MGTIHHSGGIARRNVEMYRELGERQFFDPLQSLGFAFAPSHGLVGRLAFDRVERQVDDGNDDDVAIIR